MLKANLNVLPNWTESRRFHTLMEPLKTEIHNANCRLFKQTVTDCYQLIHKVKNMIRSTNQKVLAKAWHTGIKTYLLSPFETNVKSTRLKRLSSKQCTTAEQTTTEQQTYLELQDLFNKCKYLKCNLKVHLAYVITTLSSSAPVERLFSATALILTKKSNRLSDKLFESQLLLKVNKHLL